MHIFGVEESDVATGPVSKANIITFIAILTNTSYKKAIVVIVYIG